MALINKITGWIEQNKRTVIYVLLVLIVCRFGYLNYYNWNHGNSGKPGVQYYVDSYRYLDGAENLLKGEPLGHKQAEYIGYISLLAFVKRAGIPIEFIIALQMFFALISSWFLYDMAKRITGSSLAGIIATGLYLANPFIIVWHLYLLTESLYTSLLIISAWSIARASERRSFKSILIALGTVVVTATIRPNGWILFPVMFCVFIVYSGYKTYRKYIGVALVAGLFLAATALIPASNGIIQKVERNITMNDLMTSGEVVWGHPELRISMPQDTTLHNQNWTAGYSYVLRHPFACLKLAVFRVSSEILEINRPWYSFKYRVLLYLWLWPAYLLALTGMVAFRKSIYIKSTLWIVLAHILIIALTYAEHEHRFLNYILPLIYLISACGFTALIKRARH